MIGYTEFRDTLKDELNLRLSALEYHVPYDKDNWAIRQAAQSSQRSTIRGILKLIDSLDQKENTNDREPITSG